MLLSLTSMVGPTPRACLTYVIPYYKHSYVAPGAYEPPEERPRSVRLPYYVLGKVLKTVLTYLERAAGAMYSRLLSTSHTVPANKLSLYQLVLW